MLDQPTAGLHQPVLQARQRPTLDPVRQSEPSPQVAQVVGQHAELQSHFVGPKAMARKPRPVCGLLAFFNPLLGRAALVLEAHHRPTRQRHVRRDKADAREQLTEMMLDLGHDASRLGPTLRLIRLPITARASVSEGRCEPRSSEKKSSRARFLVSRHDRLRGSWTA